MIFQNIHKLFDVFLGIQYCITSKWKQISPAYFTNYDHIQKIFNNLLILIKLTFYL